MGENRLRNMFMDLVLGSEISDGIKKQFSAKLKEGAISYQANEGGSNEDYGYRGLTGRDIKDLKPLDQSKMLRICFWLYDKNGLAHRIVERYTDFVVGDGITYSCSDPKVKDIIDDFWLDEVNQMELAQYQEIRELSIYGEQCYPVKIGEGTGRVRLLYLDPTLINDVLTDPDNVKKKTAVKFTSSKYPSGKEIKIINLNEDNEMLEGGCFYFSVNNVCNQPRGRSDLFTLADQIDSYENFLYNVGERSDLLTRVIIDLLIEGKDEKEIKEIVKKFNVPNAMEVFGHNQMTKLSFTVPDLGSADVTVGAKVLLNHILAGGGFPPHWFAGGEGLTRATAVSMDLPTKKQLKTRQKYFKWMLAYMFRFSIHSAIAKGILTLDKKNTKVNINLPKIEEKELEIVTGSLVNLTTSLMTAVEEKWISLSLATEVYRYVLSNIGMEMKEEDLTAVVTEQVDEKLRDLYVNKNRPKKVENKTEEEI